MTQYDRLDAAIGEARLDRGLSWNDLADAVGVSESALRNIRKGRNGPSELTKRRLEDALDWAHGSVDKVLQGGSPTPAKPEPPRQQYDVEELKDLRAQLDRILDRIEEIQRRRG